MDHTVTRFKAAMLAGIIFSFMIGVVVLVTSAALNAFVFNLSPETYLTILVAVIAIATAFTLFFVSMAMNAGSEIRILNAIRKGNTARSSHVVPSVIDFEFKLLELLENAELQKREHVAITSGHLYQSVCGWPPAKYEDDIMSMCCNAMRQMQKPTDVILEENTNMTIRYHFPR